MPAAPMVTDSRLTQPSESEKLEAHQHAFPEGLIQIFGEGKQCVPSDQLLLGTGRQGTDHLRQAHAQFWFMSESIALCRRATDLVNDLEDL